MARSFSRAKLGFYPLPDRVSELLISSIQPAETRGTLIDPFAGEGEAGLKLAQALNLDPHFVEIEEGRAARCAERGRTLHGPAEFLAASGGWSLALLNPPYDYDEDARRLELYYWDEVKQRVCQPGTLVILVLPERTLRTHTAFARDLYRFLEDPVSRLFPEPEYEQFHQVVVVGHARRKPLPAGALPQYLPGLHKLQNPWERLRAGEFAFRLPNAEPVTRFELSLPNWAEVERQALNSGALHSKEWLELQTPNLGQGNVVPAERLGKGHAVAAVLAGLANGLEIDGQIIKGRTRKYQTVIDRETVLEDGKLLREKGTADAIAGVLSLLDLRTLTLEVLDEAENPAGYHAFIESHLVPLAAHIDERYPPLYKGDLRPYLNQFRRMRGPRRLPGLPDAPLQIQFEKAGALIRGFDRHPVMILVGDMGTGKTTVGLVVMVVTALRKNRGRDNFKLVVWCPGHLIFDKWKVEAERILREFGVSVVVIGEPRRWEDGRKASRPLEDVRRAMAAKGPVVLVLSNQVAKNGTQWEPRVGRRRRKLAREFWLDPDQPAWNTELLCPTCGGVVRDAQGEPLAFLPAREQRHCAAPTPHPDPQAKVSPVCGCALFTEGEAGGSFGALALYDLSLRERLGKPLSGPERQWLDEWRTASGRREVLPPRTFDPQRKGLDVGLRRHPVAEFMSQHYAGQYFLIVDEVHEAKSDVTDIAQASQDLMAGARRTLLMTGTPYGGYASTIFNILHRSLPWFRLVYRHNDTRKFIDHFGLWKTVKTRVLDPNARAAGRQGYRRDDDEGWRSRTTELPGAHPGIAMLLAPITVWFGQDELDVILPRYTEKRLPVPLPPAWTPVLAAYDQLKRIATAKDAHGWSAYVQAMLGHLDRPEEEYFQFLQKACTLPALPVPDGADEFPKVQAVCDLVADRWRTQRRRSIIFFQQVNRRDPMPHYVAGLENRGLKPIILRDTVEGPKRARFIQSAVDRGGNVLLCNGKLVQTGLDLVQFSVIWRVQPTWSPYEELQQNKRIHRLGQTQDCEMVWVYWDYARSMQAYAVNLMAKKMKSIYHVGGKMAQGLAATDPDGLSFMDRLLRMAENELPLEWGDLEIVRVSEPEPAVIPAPPALPVPVSLPAPAQNSPGNFPPPAAGSHAVYTLRCTGRGVLHLQNGGAPVSVSWLGADRLVGPPDAVAVIRAHFHTHLARGKPTQKWAAESAIPTQGEAHAHENP